MNLSKNSIRGIGSLALIAVIGASGFFVVKPQVEEAFSLMSKTKEVTDSTTLREARLTKLQTENENFDALSADVNELLQRVPSDKDVTDIARAVVESLPPGVQLTALSHSDLVAGAPAYTAPKASLTPFTPPFELNDPTKAPEEKKSTSDAGVSAKPKDENKTVTGATPPFAAAPFTVTVEASSYESLTNFLDIVQSQKRLISVVAVNTSSDVGMLKATIYAYAFAGNTPQIQKWENPSTEGNK